MPTNVDKRFRTPIRGDGTGLRPHEVLPIKTIVRKRDPRQAGRVAHIKDIESRRKAPALRRPFDYVRGLFRKR